MLTIKKMSIERSSGSDRFRVSLPELHVTAGETIAITGQSGCGKSTLLEMIGLVLRPDTLNEYLFDSENCQHNIVDLYAKGSGQGLSAIRARSIGFVLQTGGLLPFLTVEENINLPCQINALEIDSDFVLDLMHILGVDKLKNRKPRDLSVGQRQRVAFVKSLAHEPSLLLADEPTAALDPMHGQKLFQLITEVVSNKGIAAIIVTHNLELVSQFGLRSIVAEEFVDGGSIGSTFTEKAQA